MPDSHNTSNPIVFFCVTPNKEPPWTEIMNNENEALKGAEVLEK